MTAMLKGYHTTSKGYSNDIKVLVLAAGLFMACICLSVCLSVSLSLTHTHTHRLVAKTASHSWRKERLQSLVDGTQGGERQR